MTFTNGHETPYIDSDESNSISYTRKLVNINPRLLNINKYINFLETLSIKRLKGKFLNRIHQGKAQFAARLCATLFFV